MAAMKDSEPPLQMGTMAKSNGPYRWPISVSKLDEEKVQHIHETYLQMPGTVRRMSYTPYH